MGRASPKQSAAQNTISKDTNVQLNLTVIEKDDTIAKRRYTNKKRSADTRKVTKDTMTSLVRTRNSMLDVIREELGGKLNINSAVQTNDREGKDSSVYIPVHFNNKRKIALVDSGARASFIRKEGDAENLLYGAD